MESEGRMERGGREAMLCGGSERRPAHRVEPLYQVCPNWGRLNGGKPLLQQEERMLLAMGGGAPRVES